MDIETAKKYVNYKLKKSVRMRRNYVISKLIKDNSNDSLVLSLAMAGLATFCFIYDEPGAGHCCVGLLSAFSLIDAYSVAIDEKYNIASDKIDNLKFNKRLINKGINPYENVEIKRTIKR